MDVSFSEETISTMEENATMSIKLSFPAAQHKPVFTQSPTSWLPSPERVAQSCAEMMKQTPPAALEALFEQMGVPSLDLTVTALSARIGLMAAARGQAFFHHELRGRLSVPKDLEPERAVWQEGTLPVWNEGVLTEPKYFSFFLEAPISPYNPNYRRKWRAHELLHGVVGFFWSPQMTRFESYLGARLDELLPIIHWYGLDEIYRPRCANHQGVKLYRQLCSPCENLAQAYYHHTDEWRTKQTPQAIRWAEQAWVHFNEEWSACLQELDTGRQCETPRPHLNASSNALGYLYSHWPRLTSWSFGTWVELFLRDGVDYFSTIPDYMQHIAQVSQNLVSGECIASVESWKQQRTRRVLQDIGYRCLLALEWLEDGSKAAYRAEDAMMPLLEQAATQCHTLLHNEAQEFRLDELVENMNATFAQEVAPLKQLPPTLAQNFKCLGYLWRDQAEGPLSPQVMAGHAQTNLTEGLESGFPQSWNMTKQPDLKDFATDDAFRTAERLTTRYSRWYSALPEHHPTALEWMKFEAWIQRSPRQDEEAERFAVLPDSLLDLANAQGTLRCHSTLRREQWSQAILKDILGEPIQEETATLAAIHHGGQQRILLLDDEMNDVLEALQQPSPLQEAWIREKANALTVLLDNSFVLWSPVPRRPSTEKP